MKNFLLFLAVVILATLSISWPHFLYFFSCKPDLLLAFTVALVFYADYKTAMIFGVLAGLGKDIFLPWALPVNTLCFGAWVYLINRLNRQISVEEDYVRLSIILGAAVLNNLILGLQSVHSGNIMPPGIFLRNLIIVSIYTTLVSPLVFKLTKKIASGAHNY